MINSKLFFQGAISALITPYRAGEVALDELQQLMHWQYQGGIRSFVLPGSTAEVLCLTAAERHMLLEAAVEFKVGHDGVQIIGAINSSSTAFAAEEAIKIAALGVDALMLTCPPYNRPMQSGLYQHFKAVHDSISLPLMIYDIPKRSGVKMDVTTIASLAELPRVMGIKDATGDIDRPMQIESALSAGLKFSLLSGDDSAALAFNANGGVGCVSVASNLVPHLVTEVQGLMKAGDFSSALSLQRRLWPLYEVMYCETNPSPTKYAAFLLGKISSPYCRLPLTALGHDSEILIRTALEKFGLL